MKSPGKGWRWVRVGEIKRTVWQYFNGFKWVSTPLPEMEKCLYPRVYRRRVKRKAK